MCGTTGLPLVEDKLIAAIYFETIRAMSYLNQLESQVLYQAET